MSDVFKTVVAVVPQGQDPFVFREEAQAVSLYSCGFIAQFTSNINAAPPPTHFMASGYIPQEAVDAMAADARFVLSDESWPVVVAQMNLVRVVYPE